MDKKLNIIRFLYSLNLGGVQKQFLKISKNLKQKFNIKVYVFSKENNFLEQDYRRYNIKIDHLINYGKYNPLTLYNTCKAIKNNKNSIIHVSKMESILPLVSLASRICNCPLVVQYHFPYSWKSKRKKIFDKLSAKLATNIISVSRFVDRHMVKNLELFEKRRWVIYNGCEIDCFGAEKESSFNIIVVSRLEKFKRVTDVIDVFNRISALRNDITLTIIGDGQCRDDVYRCAKSNDKITLLGAVKDTEYYIKKSDIGVLASTKEGLGNVVIEYIANYTVALVSNIPPINEIVPDNHTSVKFDPKKKTDLYCKLNFLLNNALFRRKLVVNAYYRSKCFDVRKTASVMEQLYNEIC